jgi:DNA-binding NarL/FixJ family response regulator
MLHSKFVVVTTVALFLILNAVDLAEDFSEGVAVEHVVHEGLFTLLALLVLAGLLKSARAISRQNERLRERLVAALQASQKAGEQIGEYRARFNEVVARQFADWKLSRSEAEVGRLLLKGLSLKEIAAVRHTQEKTVRAQASSIYRKASVEGRHAFSAWFLEEIF